MIDFKKDVFNNEKKSLQKFANEKLVTIEEKENRVETSDDFMGSGNVMDMDSIISTGDSFQLNSSDGSMGSDDLMGFDSMDDLFGGSSSSSNRDVDYDVSQDNTHRTGKWWKDFLFSPLFLVLYVSKKIIYDVPNKEDLISILKSLNTITIFTALTSFIFWLIGFKFIFNLGFQAVASTIMFGISFSILKFVFKENINIPFMKKEGENDNDNSDFMAGNDDFSMLDVDDDFSNFSDGLNLDINTTKDFDISYDDSEDYFEDSDSQGHYILPQSPIDISDKDKFQRTLLDVYKDSKKYQGVEIVERRKLLESFSGFIIANDKNFGQWRNVTPRSKEGLNMLYALYKGLVQINTTFGKDEEEMVVMSIKENPLLIKIEVDLPTYFKEKAVIPNLSVIEKMLMVDEMDDKVSVNVSYVKGLWVFKLLRLDNKNLISVGDILRFYDEDKGKTALDDFENPKLGMPILVGLKGNEFPYVIDFEANTSGVVVGGSNSGKSWFVFSVMLNFVLANDYNNVHFVIMDKKASPMWKAFAKFPHVLGHHTDILKYVELMREVMKEMARRKELLASIDGAEDIKGVREMYREEERYEELKQVPLFTVIIDEISATLSQLKTYYEANDQKELYDEFVSALSTVAFEGRSLGVRILLIGQRATNDSIPRNVLMNTSFKFGMRLESEDEYERLLDKGATKVKKPDSLGMGLLKSLDTKGLSLLKTLTIGGKNNSQMITYIRVLALEWVRRSINQDDLYNPPKNVDIGIMYNRNKFYQESIKEIKEGRILSPTIISEDAKLVESDIKEKRDYTDIQPKKIENKFGKLSENNDENDDADDVGFEDDKDSLDEFQFDKKLISADYLNPNFVENEDNVSNEFEDYDTFNNQANIEDFEDGKNISDVDDNELKTNENILTNDYSENDISALKTAKNLLGKVFSKNKNENENHLSNDNDSKSLFETSDSDSEKEKENENYSNKISSDYNAETDEIGTFNTNNEYDLENFATDSEVSNLNNEDLTKQQGINSEIDSNYDEFEDEDEDEDIYNHIVSSEFQNINSEIDIEDDVNNIEDDEDEDSEEEDYDLDSILSSLDNSNLENVLSDSPKNDTKENSTSNDFTISDNNILNKNANSDITNEKVNEIEGIEEEDMKKYVGIRNPKSETLPYSNNVTKEGSDTFVLHRNKDELINFEEKLLKDREQNSKLVLNTEKTVDLDLLLEFEDVEDSNQTYEEDSNSEDDEEIVAIDSDLYSIDNPDDISLEDIILNIPNTEDIIKNTEKTAKEEDTKILTDKFKSKLISKRKNDNEKYSFTSALNIRDGFNMKNVLEMQSDISNSVDEDSDIMSFFANLTDEMNKEPDYIVPKEVKESNSIQEKALKEAEELEKVRKERIKLEQEKKRIQEEKEKADKELEAKRLKLIEEQEKAKKYIEEAQKVNSNLAKKPSNNTSNSNYATISDVKSFIVKYGDKKGVRKRIIDCSLLEDNFSPPLIKECLDNTVIIKNGNSYLMII